MKKQVTEKYLAHLAWLKSTGISGKQFDYVYREYENTITYMNSEDWTDKIPDFKARCEKLDGLRSEKTIDACPELAPLLS